MCDGHNWVDVSYPPFCEQGDIKVNYIKLSFQCNLLDELCLKTSKTPQGKQAFHKPEQQGHPRPRFKIMKKKRPMNRKRRPFPKPKRLQKRFPRFRPIRHKMPRRRTKSFEFMYLNPDRNEM